MKPLIAVINDDLTQLRLLVGILHKGGFATLDFTSAEQALKFWVDGARPDLIVTDLNMPGIDGWRFCRLLRSPEYLTFNLIPILVVSATFSGDEAARITTDLGANAFFHFPVVGQEFLEHVRHLLAGEVSQARPRVLIVEDDETLSVFLKTIFENHGYRATAVSSGGEAQAEFDVTPSEIVVLDYHLPDVGGDDLLVRFRRQRPEAVIIMVTGDAQPDLAAKWMLQGASAYIHKPFDAAYLIRLAEQSRRERNLLHVVDLLELRTRELRENAEIHEIVANFTYDWEFWLTPNGEFRYVSPSCERITGYPPLAFQTDPGLFLRIVHSEDRDAVSAHLRKHTSAGGQLDQLDFRLHTRSGEMRWIGHVCTPVHLHSGVFSGVRASNRDITDQKRIETERRVMEQQLLHSQKLESLVVLAGGVAHEFNNLLTAVLGNLELALLDIPAANPARDSITQAIEASHRAADLVHQMLAYSGRGHFVLRPVGFNQLVQENAHLLRAAIPRTATLNFKLASELPPITADADQMQQLVMNLITNAAEAIGNQAGVVTLTTSERACDEIYLSASRIAEKPGAGRFVCVEIKDTGCGMDAATQARLFDPFFSTKFTGRGLGMAGVMGIMRGHKGAIFVKSRVGEGTTVRVLFPVSPDVPKSVMTGKIGDQATASANAVTLAGTILVVDDEQSVRKLCVRVIERLGLKVVSAADGEEALQIFKEHAGAFDCVLLDLTMPRLDGIQTFHEIKRLYPDVPVILCSGYTEQVARQRLPGEHLAGFLQKPFLGADLQNAIETVLKLRR